MGIRFSASDSICFFSIPFNSLASSYVSVEGCKRITEKKKKGDQDRRYFLNLNIIFEFNTATLLRGNVGVCCAPHQKGEYGTGPILRWFGHRVVAQTHTAFPKCLRFRYSLKKRHLRGQVMKLTI